MFARIHRATRKECSQEKYAVKIVEISTKEQRKQAENEKRMWWFAGAHDNLLLLQDVCECRLNGRRCIAFISELCIGSLALVELQDMVLHQGGIVRVLLELLQPVCHLHSVNILHRDIRPQSFLVSQDHVIKLCDFASAIYMHRNEKIHDDVLSSEYSAPELTVRTESGYGYPVDMWSLGATCHAVVVSDRIDTISSSSQTQTLAFLRSLLRDEPASRLTAQEALRHELFGLQKHEVSEARDDDWPSELECCASTELPDY